MKRILSLGGAGFIGSYIVRRLLEDGHHVTIVDNFEKYGFVQHDFFKHPHATIIRKDVRTMHPREFRGYDVVLCLAALIGGIRYFHKIPYRIARDNTEVLSAAIDATLAACPSATFVYFSSSMVYEKMQRPVREEDARLQPVPVTNYGMQKLFGEYLVRGAHEEFGLTYLTLRPFNAVGSGELPDMRDDGSVEFGMAHVIPDFCYKALVRQTPFEIFGDGKQVRTFTHARDIASAVALLLERGPVNEDFNICGEATLAMDALAERVWRYVNPHEAFPAVASMPTPSSDVRFRIGVSEKLQEHIGWSPQYDIDFIIQDTCAHVEKRLRGGEGLASVRH
jgi:nucleoside-diphosphate-sugar epimerase